MPFKQMENISNFIKGCREHLDMKEFELFTTADLYDGKSVLNVTNSLVAFSRAAQRKGYEGFVIGPKESVPDATKHWEVGGNAQVSKLSLGSSETMQHERVHDLTGPAWKAQNESCAAQDLSKLSLGSSQTMQHSTKVDTTAPTWKADQLKRSTEEKRDRRGIVKSETVAAEEEAIGKEEERVLREVLEELSGLKLDGELLECLKDGVALCTALNAVIPGAVPKINSSKIPFKQRENVGNFVRSCKSHGVLKEHELFETSDLFNRRNVKKVVSSLQVFCKFAREKQTPQEGSDT